MLTLILISLILQSVRFVASNLGMLYTLSFQDKLPNENIITEEKVGNRIHCASFCIQNPSCEGFAFDSKKKCILFDLYMNENFCDKETCSERQGVKIYMSKQEATTTTETPSTSTTTTEKPTTTTTEKPTTTTTEKPTTTTEQPTTTTEKPTTTTTEKPTTTTTEQPTTTTTEEPTTTTTEMPTTTTTTTEMPTTTTTTTEKPTTTTTEKPTTTKEPTSTTTEEPTTREPTTKETTTVEAMTAERTTFTMTEPEIQTITMPRIPSTFTVTIPTIEPTIPPKLVPIECNSIEPLLMGFIADKYFFDGEPMKTIVCLPYGTLQDPYEGETYMVDAKGKTSGQCKTGHGVVTMIITVKEEKLDGFVLACRRLKKDAIENTVYKNPPASSEALCKQGDVITGLEVQLDEQPHLLNLICQKIKSSALG